MNRAFRAIIQQMLHSLPVRKQRTWSDQSHTQTNIFIFGLVRLNSREPVNQRVGSFVVFRGDRKYRVVRQRETQIGTPFVPSVTEEND